MPTEVYPVVTIGGQDFYQTQTLIPVDYDPDAGVLVFVGTPAGGVMAAGPLIRGDNGKPSIIDTTINLTELDWDDPTPASASFTEITPGDEDTSQVVQLSLELHAGEPGDDTVTSLDLDSVDGTPVAGLVPALNSGADGLEWVTVKVGDRYIPASINSIASGNATATLCQVSIGPLEFDWRPECLAQCQITPTSSDVAVRLFARLNNASSGNIVGQSLGVANQSVPHNLIPGPAGGSASSTFDKVNAGDTATIYLRAERQAGTGTFTTSNTDTIFWVKANKIT